MAKNEFFSVKLSGVDAIIKQLKGMDEKAFNAVLRPAMRRAMKALIPHIQTLTPVDTGALRMSYKVVAPKPKPGLLVMKIRTGNQAAIAVEYGTEDTPAFAMMRKALEANWKVLEDEVVTALTKYIAKKNRAIAKATKKAAKK